MALVLLALSLTFSIATGASPAAAATNAGCDYADPGTGKFANTLCWLDFSGLNATQAQSGQDFEFALPGGNKLTLTVKRSGGPIAPASYPTWSGAYLGNSGHYSGVSGKPALYQTTAHTNSVLTVSNPRVFDRFGREVTEFSLVGADAESTDINESITWDSSGPIESLTANGADRGIGNACGGGYTGIGTTSVKCTGSSTGNKTGTAIVATRRPSTFSQTMVGGGLEAVSFGVLISSVKLNKQVDSRFAGDDFGVSVDNSGGTVGSAATGPTGASATTGRLSVVTPAAGEAFTLSESARSGDLRNYAESWKCTRFGQVDATLPQGSSVGTKADVHLGIGDDVECTITNSKLQAGIALQKHAGEPVDANKDGITDAGDTIAYTFTVTNTGQTPLTKVAVSDAKVGTVTCPDGDLAPGASVTCTAAPYTITADDQGAGAANNTATASGTPPGTSSPISSDPSSTSTPVEKPQPALSLTKSATPSDAAAYQAGQRIDYSFVVTNTGNVAVNDISVSEESFSGSGKMSAINCPANRSLAAGASLTCTASYVLTQADVDAGQVTNSAGAQGVPATGGTVNAPVAQARVPADANPSISLTKAADPASVPGAGSTITYSFALTNTGNVTLSDPKVDEGQFSGTGQLSAITCPAHTLKPGEQTTCTATYTVTKADADAGRIQNSATATATPPSGPAPVSRPSTATVTIPPAPALGLKKTATPGTVKTVGEKVTYTFALTNNGNVTLHDLKVDESSFSGSGDLGPLSCPATSLAAGDTINCTASYSITQADLDAGGVTNTATASGTPPSGGEPASSAPSSAKVDAVAAPALSLAKSASTDDVASGSEIVYSFKVTNTGNVSVSNPSVKEGSFSGSGKLSAVSCPRVTLAPGDSTTCTATYTVTDDDARAGKITNSATATAVPPTGVGAPTSNEASAVVKVQPLPDPHVTLAKSADVKQFSKPGETITYSFVVHNTGNVALSKVTVDEGTFSGTGKLSPVTCPTDSLQPDESTTCTATYSTTQADVDAGGVRNAATASGTPPKGDAVRSPESAVEVPSKPSPALSLVKSADRTGLVAGQKVTYSFVVTNTGNVTLRDVGVDEGSFSGSGQLGEVSCPEGAGSLAPGAQVTCSASYVVTQADVDRGELTNSATASGTPPGSGDPVRSAPSGTRLPESAAPALTLDKKADIQRASRVGQVITYTFTITNTGNVTVTDPKVKEGEFTGHGQLGPARCPADTDLVPGASVVCTASYTVVLEDLLGQGIHNVATALGDAPGGTVESAPDAADVAVPMTPAPPAVPTSSAPLGGSLPATGAPFSGWVVAAAGLMLLAGAMVLAMQRRAAR